MTVMFGAFVVVAAIFGLLVWMLKMIRDADPTKDHYQ